MIAVGVVGHRGYAALPDALRTVTELAPSLGITIAVEERLLELMPGAPTISVAGKLDALLTFGGDGTLLRGARMVERVPILGVNLGRLGFLTGAPVDELPLALQRLSRGEYTAEPRMALEAVVIGVDGKERARWIALNDIVVHKGGFARVVSLRVAVDGEPIATYPADGVVLSTPTGSTAYSLSAGGPVVYPTLNTIVVTAVSAHTLAIRPVILPATADVTVQANDVRGELLVTVDGQVGTRFEGGETLSVKRAALDIPIIRFPGSTFFSTLRHKLGWGGLVERDERAEC